MTFYIPKVDGERITPNHYSPHPGIVIKLDGRYAVVSLYFGLVVKFDGRHYLEVAANEEYRGI